MEQLSGLDAAFVHQDSARTPMHVTAVLLYDSGREGAAAVSLEELRRLVAGTLRQVPVFSRKLRRVVLDMDAPYWVDVPRPDLRWHVSTEAIAPGSGWPGLLRRVTAIHQRRLDLSRPLWEMRLVDGLDGLSGMPERCQALVIKVHHAAVDGMALAALIDAIHRQATSPQRPDGAPPRAPDYWDIWTRLNVNSIGRQFKLAGTVGNLVPAVLRVRRSSREFSDLPPVQATRAHFNDRVEAGRTLGVVTWPRGDFLAIKRAVRRVTLNDIALAIVAGALRQYLAQHGRLPSKSLAAGVPISLRGTAVADAVGNRIATMAVGLATSVADPVQRLRLVHQFAVAGKRRIDALGTGTVMDISDSVSPNVLGSGIRALARASRMPAAPVPFHTMVSNVPGPPTPLRLGAAELVVPFGFGPVRDNMGLFHIVSNSDSRVSLSFTACSKLLPDGLYYRQCLADAGAELLARAVPGC